MTDAERIRELEAKLAEAEQSAKAWEGHAHAHLQAFEAAESREEALRGRVEALIKSFDGLWGRYQYVAKAANLAGEMNQLRLKVEEARAALAAVDRCHCGKYDLAAHHGGRRESDDTGWHRREGCPGALAAGKEPA